MSEQSSKIESLTAFEMSVAERTAGQSITSLEDENAPKVALLGALAWVYAKRSDPTLTFQSYMQSRTLAQITEDLGLDDDEDADEGVPAGRHL